MGIDLVNGPQDFSCCSGYTCAERLSTFFTMVATGQEYEIVMSSIPPQNFKFHMLHNGDAENPGAPVRVKMWFPKQQRLDLYTDGRYIPPMNKDFSVTDGHSLLPSDNKFIPSIESSSNCDNYFDPNTGHLYLTVKGPSTCDVKTQPVVILKLGITVPEAEFFDADSIVGNIAGLLGIPAANIRVTFSIWDMGQDVAASAEVLGIQTWECSLAFTINVPVAIVGQTSAVIAAGTSNGMYEVKFEGLGLNLQFTTTCTSPESGRSVMGTSNTFIVFPGSSADTGLLRQTSIALMYSGPYTVIQGVVDAFNEELGSLECDNCPETASRRKRSLLTGNSGLNLTNFQYCSSPTSLRQDGSCRM